MTKTVAIRSAVILALVLTGCAKQPSTTQLTSAAPSGGSGGTASTPDATRQASLAAAEAARGAGGTGTSGSAGARPPVQEFRDDPGLGDIHFDYDKADIRETEVTTLERNAGWLKEHPGHLLLIEGHCDERGTNEYNTALGDRRAKATMNYLVSRGVAASRITVISYGEERPTCRQHDPACWAKNRRAHFLVKPR